MTTHAYNVTGADGRAVGVLQSDQELAEFRDRIRANVAAGLIDIETFSLQEVQFSRRAGGTLEPVGEPTTWAAEQPEGSAA
jgi:hypothetical protein